MWLGNRRKETRKEGWRLEAVADKDVRSSCVSLTDYRRLLLELLADLGTFRMWEWEGLLTKALVVQWLLWCVPPLALAASSSSLPAPPQSSSSNTNTASHSDNSIIECDWKEVGEGNFTDNTTTTILTVRASRDSANMTVFYHVSNSTSTYMRPFLSETITTKPKNIYLQYKKLGEFAITFVAKFMGKSYNKTVMGGFTFQHFKLTGDISVSRNCTEETPESVVQGGFILRDNKELVKLWSIGVLSGECVILVVAGLVVLVRYKRRVRPQY